ncbi:FAD-dependent oxidoreductase [Phosphitispora sp. TUW77]|uniref:FAD-dependent oxidoreductase n=1 Tax=Phosphitispora sp. TUW77 TaxID=3152361 RepID=UPI003AB3013D
MKVVVAGGGWAGCASAYFASKAGAEVILVEKTDLLLGTGLVGGIIRNNGRYTAAEEAIALGGGDIFRVIESVARHRDINFPGHSHAMLYDVQRIERVVRRCLEEQGVKILFKALINSASVHNQEIEHVVTSKNEVIPGDVFIDATGTAGPMHNCIKYGTGCAMCILRCPSFGPRVSLTALAGVKEIKAGESTHQFEAMSGSCKLDKKSLNKSLVKELDRNGIIIIPLPEHYHKKDSLRKKACQQYAMEEYSANLIILDTGHAKLMTPFFPIESLRELEGFREARYADPYSGGQGNSVRFMAMAPCDDYLRVNGIKNLLCAGEKTGPLVGHTEAIVTGMLAGNNAVRLAKGMALRILPSELAVGDIISFMHKEIRTEEGLQQKYTFSGSVYFKSMVDKGMYITNRKAIREKVRKLGLTGYFQ